MKILDGAWKISMLVILSAGIYLTACTKKAQLIGKEIRPTTDIEVEMNDTASIVAYSVLTEPIITTNYGRILLGSTMDPVFGKTTANYFTQLRLKSGIVNFNFGQNAVIDSLILTLAYDGYYGDTTTMQTLRVYELNEKMISDSGFYYYSNDQISHYATEIGRTTFQPQPNTPVYLKDSNAVAPHIRINLMELTDEFGNKFLNTPIETLGDNEKFDDYINGLCVISDPVNEGGAIMYINILSSYTDLTVYYRNDASNDISYIMNLYDSVTHFTQYDHNNYLDASPEFKSQVLDGDTSLGQDKLYIQSLSGVATKIKFPFIKNFKSIGKIAINSAELTVRGLEENNSVMPDRLTIVEVNSDGRAANAIIDVFEGETYFGGFHDTINDEYTFQIARYIQQLLKTDATDYGIFLKMYGSYTNGGQYIFKGTNPSLPTPYSDRIKLKVTYTIIE